ncbi:cyclase/dehydrase family protein [Metarhizium album ARSEF 1941]|uniref:Cyclase/dehydrase family protein n=1 Tax=Metarhizium album (strain ARSEF 1941) TaxID=1081103 RepID=A0A0B2WN83_METAS|nr:cyclase/dehydrase family protein [Metarhizium album ARSEF 1941]KHN95398.1 cyclase/dehydrase family protein [Metarhizium album ARSEF 1941]
MSLRTATRQVPLRSLAPFRDFSTPSSCRPFFSLPGSPPGSDTQTITAIRTLPYAQHPLYQLISDVDSYSSFVPYCAHSRVTQWSHPDQDGRKWPTLADLHVGWGGFNEVFTSRLRCVPGVLVEAVSGNPASVDAKAASAVFKSLVTRWHLTPIRRDPSPATEVHLTIEYQFVSPLYAAVSAAVSDKVAGLMIEAFEKRASEELSYKQNL